MKSNEPSGPNPPALGGLGVRVQPHMAGATNAILSGDDLYLSPEMWAGLTAADGRGELEAFVRGLPVLVLATADYRLSLRDFPLPR